MTPTPATPTDAEREIAADLFRVAYRAAVMDDAESAEDAIAQALADQRARYEAVAEELQAMAEELETGGGDPHAHAYEVAAAMVRDAAAERIRKVAGQA